MESDSLSPSPDAWEYPSVPGGGIDLQADPEGGAKRPNSCARWFELVDGGDITFITSMSRTVTFTGLGAGAAYAIQIAKITSATGRIRVGW